MAYVHTFARKVLTRRFKQLYQQSQLVFCVNEELQQALGSHSNLQILFPIPNPFIKREFLGVQEDGFTVTYAGTLSGIYGSMMQDLCQLCQDIPKIKLKLFGPPLDWPELIVQQVKANGIYGGFISRDMLIDELRKAKALLVAMSFNQRDKMRMHTSFPSKIIEYCQFGKPIIIWGPDYSSAVRWGQKYQSALVVTSPSAQTLVEAIEELAVQPEEQIRLGNKALEIAREMFNPDKIQQKFMSGIYQFTTANLKSKS